MDEAVHAGIGGSSNSLSSSSNSVYEDAQDQVSVPLVAPAPERRGESEMGAETVPLLASDAEETDSLPVLGVEEPAVFVEESVHNVEHGDEEDLALQDPPAEVFVAANAPIAEPYDEEDLALPDPLAASPLLMTLGFGRVQTAYEQWLVNMSHAVSLFQGNS